MIKGIFFIPLIAILLYLKLGILLLLFSLANLFVTYFFLLKYFFCLKRGPSSFILHPSLFFKQRRLSISFLIFAILDFKAFLLFYLGLKIQLIRRSSSKKLTLRGRIALLFTTLKSLAPRYILI